MRIDNPYADLTGGQWLRGNLHAHTTQSDGQRHLQIVVADYAQAGHDFLMISDHDCYTSPEIYNLIDPCGLILIPGNEISAGGPHLLHVNADCRLHPASPRQRVISQANSGSGFIVICHPNWGTAFDHCPVKQMSEWVGCVGLEIFNGVITRLEGSPYALDKWDMLLSAGCRLWGFANDDSHLAYGDVDLGWNVVYARDRSAQAIVSALASGRFYASTGVKLQSIEVNNRRIRVEATETCRIVALQQHARQFAAADGTVLEVEVPSDAAYVRFECWGTGRRCAWTQPFFVDHG